MAKKTKILAAKSPRLAHAWGDTWDEARSSVFADVDNLLIFQSQELVVKSFSLVHTLVQKLGRIDKDDLDDIQAILSFIES